MTALAQGSAGLALVMSFALLRASRLSVAALLLGAQSAAVAVTAVVMHRPLIAVAPLILGGAAWLFRHRTPLDSRTMSIGGAKLGISAGAVLAILCQSQGSLALPLAIVLLSVLLGATRSHPMMQVMALAGMQNGLALAVCLLPRAQGGLAMLVPALNCLLLPLPLAAGLLLPAIASWPDRDPSGHGSAMRLTSWLVSAPGAAGWLRWLDLALAAGMLCATLIVQVDSFGAIFAPLLGLDGVLRAWARQQRRMLSPARRGFALAQTGFSVLAVCSGNLLIAWLALLAATATALLPTVLRQWANAVLAFLGAGIALLGIMLPVTTPSVLAGFAVFAGFAMLGAVVPDLAVVLAVLILRLANQSAWPPAVEAVGAGIAVAALLACAALLARPFQPRRIVLLQLSQASIAVLAICVGQAEGRFAALVLLILLILCRAAARVTLGPVAAAAVAGLGGISPVGVFPGLVLVVLAITSRVPWALVPLGVALVPITLASMPRRLHSFPARLSMPSIAWVPLLLAVLVGYCTPVGLVHWWRVLTSGPT